MSKAKPITFEEYSKAPMYSVDTLKHNLDMCNVLLARTDILDGDLRKVYELDHKHLTAILKKI